MIGGRGPTIYKYIITNIKVKVKVKKMNERRRRERREREDLHSQPAAAAAAAAAPGRHRATQATYASLRILHAAEGAGQASRILFIRNQNEYNESQERQLQVT